MSPDSHAQQTQRILRYAQVVLRPLVAWLLRSGITYGLLERALKLVFLEQAEQELLRQGKRCTDSSLSAVSGLNRKIVREMWRETRDLQERVVHLGRPSLASRVLTSWRIHMESAKTHANANEAATNANRHEIIAQGQQLPYSSTTASNMSFESLVTEVSGEVRPRSVLNELLRLGLVQIHHDANGQEWVLVQPEGFLPRATSDEALELLSGAVADHFWTGINNVTQVQPSALDQSIFANGLSLPSVQELGVFARKQWEKVFPAVVHKASELYQKDLASQEAGYRMRIGMYFHQTEDDIPATEQIALSPATENIDTPVKNHD